jgi:hypothetical protein
LADARRYGWWERDGGVELCGEVELSAGGVSMEGEVVFVRRSASFADLVTRGFIIDLVVRNDDWTDLAELRRCLVATPLVGRNCCEA